MSEKTDADRPLHTRVMFDHRGKVCGHILEDNLADMMESAQAMSRDKLLAELSRVTAERDAAASMLLSVQADCVAARERVQQLEAWVTSVMARRPANDSAWYIIRCEYNDIRSDR